ncbi:ring-cleaving dioxygenase [Microvirga sp. 17 mud 1-3]|uniref:ring-cleaving dioxygenase n=1 Tax=Microvirga sp. 17 mud 1-3 TaxID=2082949 RepID=UPI000D6AF582|nr:ring-cleaving dioxygenase [Microvirga sp. 17 mud 1-3]AWM85356.1 ring-cleaving dioxygenase [Microvirga sp. 17 mud 1-3]
MKLTGIHHLTAVTANAKGNHDFYTQALGMRLVKKTVNQDDVSAYHLFYGDGRASPGSDITFFDWPVGRERRGTHSVVHTALRVTGEKTLAWWKERLDAHRIDNSGIVERDGRLWIDFEDPEGQRLGLVDDGGRGDPSHAWERSPVPAEHQIRGLGPITLSVPTIERTALVLTAGMDMRAARDYRRGESPVHVFEMGEGGPAAELHVAVEPHLPPAQPGAGGVHHVAFRTPDDETYADAAQRLQAMRAPSSGPVDRYYFRSLYFREPNGILFEIATDGPGFATDEPMESLGERLALPPFLEPRRAEIEAGLKPL